MTPFPQDCDAVALAHFVASECLPPARMWEVRLSGGSYQPIEEEHLAVCVRCQARDRAVLMSLAPPKLLFRSDKPLTRFQLANAADKREVVPTCRQPLHFEGDNDLEGSFYLEDGTHWLMLTHRRHPVGTLLDVRLEDVGGAVTRRFVMLYQGRRGVKGRLRLEEVLARSGDVPLTLEVVSSAADLLPEAAEVLRLSYEAALRDDSEAVAVWRSWAGRQAGATNVGEVLKVIAADERPVSVGGLRSAGVRFAPLDRVLRVA